MDFKQFLQSITHDSQSIYSRPVTYFIGEEPPILFFSLVFSRLRKNGIEPTYLDIRTEQLKAKAQLQTTFLGSNTLFVLKGFSELSPTAKKEWVTFLKNYQGPHSIILHVTSIEKKQAKYWVELPEKIEANTFDLLCKFAELSIPRTMIDPYIFARTLTLDDGCMLLHYINLAGKNSKRFFIEWFDKIVPPTSSLFTLSKYFFAKKPQAFFREWKQVHDCYTDPFWIHFWSEQLWRARTYIQLKNEKSEADAKRISFRLPFSFTQYDWKKHSCDSLDQSHQFVYNIDYRMKHGSMMPALDLFYSRFFENIF